MAPVARTKTLVKGKEIIVLIKKPAGTDYILFGCMTAADLDSPGAEVEETACRSGTEKSPSGDIAVPTLSIEHIVRHYATGDQATNVSDDEVQQWNDTAQIIDLKYSVGDKIGDPVYTGQGFFNGFSRKGPQKGDATGGATFNFLTMPTRSVIVAP
ncbi:hypothetical protein [Spirosoma endbachense]|uniref:Uncharacterized protein n=1 Tax=Spirosoma endbachense TaxID=2666025 RepID=A0A6P1VUB4_9BACT|nr:hypothetical protein [Spirosoma endbachense]QHV96295.1 hypothetical protein GJR95_15280 [Spirosoma endbachense]